jgi:hypothetical protein
VDSRRGFWLRKKPKASKILGFLRSQELRNGKGMTDTTNLVLLAKLDIRDALNHKLVMAYYFVPKALAYLKPNKAKI